MLFEFVKKWCIVSTLMFISTLLTVYISKRFSKHIDKLPFLLYGLHPVSAHLILSKLYKQRKITLLNIVSVIVFGNVILKIKEFLIYSVPIGLYVLKELWIYLLLVAIIYMTYLSIFATFFMLKFRIKEIVFDKKLEQEFSWRKVLKLFLRVWIIYTIVYYLLTFLLTNNYVKYIVEVLKLLPLDPYVSTLLTTYMFSPVATWHFIEYFWSSKSLTIADVVTIFVLGRYLHFILHVLRDGLPILTTLYGVKTSIKIVCINVTILSIIYGLTFITITFIV